MRIKTTDNGDFELTPQENAEYDARELAWSAGARDRMAVDIRTERSAKIAACDWRMLIDSPGGAGWKVYRQALRDVPQQAGFPENVVWPVAP